MFTVNLPTNYVKHISLQITVREALHSALDEEMSADSRVFLMGEEVNIISDFQLENIMLD